MGFRKAVGFSGPSRGPMSSRGAHRNDIEKSACKACRPFFLVITQFRMEKNVRISMKTFFFIFLGITKFRPEKPVKISVKTFFVCLFVWRSHHNSRKLRHFLRLFWSSQNWKSVIFELAPGIRSALGAPDFNIFFDNLFFDYLIKIIVDFLNLIYFATCKGRQKPKKHYVIKSHKIIVDSPISYSGSLLL